MGFYAFDGTMNVMLGEASLSKQQRAIVGRNLELTNGYAAACLSRALHETGVATALREGPISGTAYAASHDLRGDILSNACEFLVLRGALQKMDDGTFAMRSAMELGREFERQHAAAHLLTRLEESGVLAHLAGTAFVPDAASLSEHECALLAELSFLQAQPDGTYAFTRDDYYVARLATNFLLAYRAMFEAAGGLLAGSVAYSDVARDGAFLKNTGTYADMAINTIAGRLRAHGITSVLDIGCGGGELLRTLARSSADFRGIGVDIDASAVEALMNSQQVEVLLGDGARPETFADKVPNKIGAITSLALFHEFRTQGDVGDIFASYKRLFPRARFFLVEFDIPSWDDLHSEAPSLARAIAGFYLITHHMSEQGLPQTSDVWKADLERGGWRVERVHHVFNRLAILECI